jgi:hypothetical protein
MTNKDLKNLYRWHNKKHFGNRLPDAVWVGWHETVNKKHAAEFVSFKDGSFAIFLKPKLKKLGTTSYAHSCLLHEMVHCKLMMDGKRPSVYNGHDRLFQNEMKRLANIGALKSLW